MNDGRETGKRARTSNLVSIATGFRPRRAPPSSGLLRDARELLLRAAHSRPPAPRAYLYGTTPGGEMTGTTIRFFFEFTTRGLENGPFFLTVDAYGFEWFHQLMKRRSNRVHKKSSAIERAPFGWRSGRPKQSSTTRLRGASQAVWERAIRESGKRTGGRRMNPARI